MDEPTDARKVDSAEEIGIGGRMVGALLSPGRTFASVNARTDHRDWYLPMIVIAIVGMFSAYLLMPAAQTAGMQAMQEQFAKDESLTEEQRSMALENAQRVMGIGAVVLPPIGTAVTIFVQAAIFLALANFVFGGDGTYKKMLAVVSYSSLVAVPAAIVALLLGMAWDAPTVQLGLGLLAPESMKGSYIHHFLSMVTVFAVWKYLLVSVGLGVVAGIRTKLAFSGIFGLWVLYLLAAAGARTVATV
jgi:hypothetical protein